MRARLCLATTLVIVALAVSTHAQSGLPQDAVSALDRITNYVADYYSRAQSLVGTETISIQPVSQSFGLDGFARMFINELRIEWAAREEGSPAVAIMQRKLLKANGRAPKPNDTPACEDPRSEVVEPLSMFLPGARDDYEFSWKGMTQEKEGRLMMLDFRERHTDPPTLEVNEVKKEDCYSMTLPGWFRGRVWAFPETGVVVRLDRFLNGPVDVPVPRSKQHVIGNYVTVDRSSFSYRYRPVTFQDPAETLYLPATIDSVWSYRSAFSSKRTMSKYTDYRRFITGGRIVE